LESGVKLSRKTVSAIMMSLLVLGILALASDIQQVKASGTIYIRADGSIDPPEAPISTVDNVTYTLTGSITSDADGIVVERSNIIMDGNGYTLQGSRALHSNGINLIGRSSVTIKNTTVKAFYYGIRLDYSSNNSIVGNNPTDNYFGIVLHADSVYNSISGNNITTSFYGYGIYLNGSSNHNWISENNITNNSYGVYLNAPSNNSISGNSIAASVHGVYLGSSSNNSINGNSITKSSQNGIWLRSSNYTSISGNNITNNSDGVSLEYSSSNIIIGNSIANNTYGVSLAGNSSNNNISGNTFLNDGLSVGDYCYGNVVSDNLVNGNPLVYLEGASDCAVGDAGQVILVNCRNITVENQNLSNASVGVELWGTNNTKIARNNITGNWVGIYHYYSYNNSIVGNAIADSWQGIRLFSSSGSRIFHNDFVGNNRQISTEGSDNVWDDGYPSGGNYWSNLAGSDMKYGAGQNLTGSDGIRDTSYLIDAMHESDNYPLMGMFSDFNATSDQHVATICNSTISDFQFNGTAIMFNATGAEGTAGFCRICVPTSLMNATYRVFVNGTETQCDLLPCSSSSYSYLYFTYSHSTEQITIVPEFPSTTILAVFMALSMLAAALTRKNRTRRFG
jgi:parallel beta-helix repeat protein